MSKWDEMLDPAREAAYEVVMSSIDLAAAFPGQVFKGNDLKFRFFESDRIFVPSFVDIVSELMSIDDSVSACLINISRMSTPAFREVPAIFFESGMTGAEYDARLRRGGPATGWLFGMDHYGCASNRGRWLIYCEKDNDVAVAALRGRGAAETFSGPMSKLNARAVDDLNRQGSSAPFPFNSLVPRWRTELSSRYGSKAL